MRKLKLLLASVALLFGGGISVWAQTDVTSTYLTNADFEGDYSSYKKPSNDRDIYKPNGWNISYTNGEGNDLTSLYSETTQWGNFSSKPQPVSGTKAYWMRFRWGSSENITLSQETSANLPAGTYCVSADAYSDDNTGTVTISVAGVSQTVRSNGAWTNYKVVFTLASAEKVTVSLSYTNTAADNQVAAFDNVKILDLSSEPTGVALKNELSGTAANLSDFNVWYNDYTLEVAGTADTEITVAADNISYIPEATGTVRFVKKNDIVYVYEGTAYKKAVYSSKADYTYTRTLSGSDSSTGNILENGSFETVGDVLTANKAWKLGSPWVVANFNWGGDGSGIRVQANGSTKRLVWRGSGNNAYFSQPLSLILYKGYKVYLQQVGGGNATANFNIGIGNAAGDYSYLSAQMNLGNGKNGTYNAVLGANENIPASGAYFTFRNTSSNTASSGSDPVTQLDWIGLVYSDDFPITGVSSASYVYGTAYAPATAKSSYLAAKAEAESIIADATYDYVTGEERSNLQTAIDAIVEDNDAAYNAATENIQNKQSAFTTALTHYQALIDAQAAVPNLSYASTSTSAFKTAVATSAADADEKLAAMTTKVRAYYESHVMAEGNATTVDYSSAVSSANANTNTGWTNGIGTNTNEGYTDAAGIVSTKYLDGGWSATAGANIDMTRSVEIPAGKYLLTVTARGATDLTTYTLSIGGETVALPKHGSTGGVFGRGWDDVSVEFDADGTTQTLEVIANSTSYYQWISINRFRLVRLDATLATSDDYTALNSAISTARAKTLGFEDGEYAPYANAEVLAKLAEANAIDQDANNEQSVVQDLTTYLNNASNWTANDGTVDIIYNGNFAEPNGSNPKGWTRSNGAWGQQITGLTAATNDVNEGTTTGWYYNTEGAWEYGKDDVYKMPLAESQAYILTFKYRSHASNSNNNMKASVLNDSSEGLAEVTFAKNGDATKFVTATAYFTTGAAGNYILSLTQSGNTHLTDVSIVKVASTTKNISEEATAVASENHTFYETVSLTRTLSKDYWNTFSVPFDMAIPDGWSVKEFDSASDNVINFKDASTIKAGEPYLVKPNVDVENPVYYNVIVSSTEGSTDGTGEYKFAAQIYAKDLATDGTIAYLATDGSVKKLTSGGIKGLRAYFIIPASVSSARIAFIDDEITGIKNLTPTLSEGEGVYDLQGRKVAQPTKGLYIQNGKKVIMK